MRQRDRATKSDREVEDAIRTFYTGGERTTHYVALAAANFSTPEVIP